MRPSAESTAPLPDGERGSCGLSRIAPGIVVVRIATDEQPYVGVWVVETLRHVAMTVGADPSIHVVVLEGEGRYFSAGASRESLLDAPAEGGVFGDAAELPRLLLSIPVPVIAAMTGHAIGGGFVLGLWCDVAVLAEESLYGASFMALGFTPGMGSTRVLAEALGAPLARELLLSGRLVKGRELQRTGGPLAHAVVPRSAVHHRAVEIAEELAGLPRESLALLKQTLARRRLDLLESALADEHAMRMALFATAEVREDIAQRYPARRAEPPPLREDRDERERHLNRGGQATSEEAAGAPAARDAAPSLPFCPASPNAPFQSDPERAGSRS